MIEQQPLVMPKDIPTVQEMLPVPGITPKQESRLRAFAHIVHEATETLGQLGKFDKVNWTAKFPNGTSVVHFEITEGWVYRMNQMAFNIYAEEFMPDPKLKTFADAILQNNEIVKKADYVPTDKLNAMWDN